MEVKMNVLTPALFLELYTSVGWDPPGLEQVALELISTKGAVAFCRKQGFEERPCEWDRPGMFNTNSR